MTRLQPINAVVFVLDGVLIGAGDTAYLAVARQINPRAELETIERVYRILAGRYRPDNQQTGDTERFRLLTEAYENSAGPRAKGQLRPPV